MYSPSSPFATHSVSLCHPVTLDVPPSCRRLSSASAAPFGLPGPLTGAGRRESRTNVPDSAPLAVEAAGEEASDAAQLPADTGSAPPRPAPSRPASVAAAAAAAAVETARQTKLMVELREAPLAGPSTAAAAPRYRRRRSRVHCSMLVAESRHRDTGLTGLFAARCAV